MEQELRKIISKSLDMYTRELGIDIPQDFIFDLGVTKDASHGDFATNAAFKLSKLAGKNPRQTADEITHIIQNSECSVIERIEVAGPGFINFYVKKSSLAEVLIRAHQDDKKYGQSSFGAKKRVLLEYVSANPTGPLTIAHGRQAAIGDSLSRILKVTGHDVYREFYLNDAGRQMNLLGQSVWARYCEEFSIDQPFPEDGYHGEYIRDIARKIINEKRDELLKDKQGFDRIQFFRDYAKDEMMKDIRDVLKAFRVEFDNYFSESTLYAKNRVEAALEYLKKENLLYEQDGALWFRSTDYGDDKDRVVKKSTGDYTYLAPDIAYHSMKYERDYNLLINLWGPDHHGYISRLKAACQGLGHEPEEIAIRIVQLVSLYRSGEPVRMSTRAGEFVTLQELVDEVGVDAARFFFIMRRVESPLDFDLELAKEKTQDNPVYYLQYAHARIASIVRFADQKVSAKANLELLNEAEEYELIKYVSEYPKILIQASELLEPYRLTDYLRELAAVFHKFYAHHRVVTEDKALTESRLLLCDAVRIVMRNGLELLGVSQPESM